MIDAGSLARALVEVQDRIVAAGGDLERVRLVAVTKGFGPEAVTAALSAGVADVGESYAQELLGKAGTLEVAPRWHFIGRLQRNKVKALADRVWLWQSLDRLSLAEELARRAGGARALVQVNISGEQQKGGCPVDQVAALVAAARDLGLDVVGLMGVAPNGPTTDARPAFRLLSRLADRLDLPERSMGMSGDLEAAVAEGATMVRVGTALFGPRDRIGQMGD